MREFTGEKTRSGDDVDLIYILYHTAVDMINNNIGNITKIIKLFT